MIFSRIREILGGTPLGQVELLLAFESIALAVWMLFSGGDCTFKVLSEQLQAVIPVFKSGRVPMAGLAILNAIRIWAVVKDYVLLRCWVARLNAFGWLSVLLVYGVVGIGANELPLYFVFFLANFWLSVRLDERGIRERASAGNGG